MSTETTMQNYQELALRTESPITPELIERLTGNARAVHAFFGLLTETGELADGFKRAIFYGKPLDTTNIKEEVGDVFWYMAILCDTLGINFISCMEANIQKLKKRYPDKYSHEAALNRNLEAERKVLEQSQSIDILVSADLPWLQPNRHGEKPGGICCQRATGISCYEHDPANYIYLGGEYLLKCNALETTEVKKPDPNCKQCEGTGQDGGKDASFNSPPCPECFPEHKEACEHTVQELHADGSTTCHYCRKEFTAAELKADTKADTGPLPEEEKAASFDHSDLIKRALNNGWVVSNNGHLYLPGDISKNWAAGWRSSGLYQGNIEIMYPHWLKRRMHEIDRDKQLPEGSPTLGELLNNRERVPLVNGFDCARELASWMDGQTRERALKHIARREQQYKEQTSA